LKYFYLLFSPDNLLPLDSVVFNTEAHPLPMFDMGELFKTGWERLPRDANGNIVKERPKPKLIPKPETKAPGTGEKQSGPEPALLKQQPVAAPAPAPAPAPVPAAGAHAAAAA